MDFEAFRLGPQTGKKDKENARQAWSHAHRFCAYMLAGCGGTAEAGVHDLRFLCQMDKLRMQVKIYAIVTLGYIQTLITCHTLGCSGK